MRRVLLAALGLVSCTLAYGDPPVGQCVTDADCRALPANQTLQCDHEYSVCVTPLTASPTSDGSPGDSPLRTPRCPLLEGAWDDPDAVVVGTISPHLFRVSGGEPLVIPYVSRWLNAVNLGMEEWQRELPGGRLGRSGRPLALVHCNSSDSLAEARLAMTHLVSVAGAPVVIALTDNDLAAVRYQAQRTGTTVVCATCVAGAPSEPGESRLIWQIAPPLVEQAPMATFRATELAEQLRAERGLTVDQSLQLVILSQDYPGINQLVGEVRQGLGSLASVNQSWVQTLDPRAGDTVQLAIAREVIRQRPAIIIVGMDTDFTTYYLRMIEDEWPGDAPRPHYVLTYLNQELGLLGDIVRDDDDLRVRLSGTAWGLEPRVLSNHALLADRFRLRYSQELDNAQFGYDAFYAAAYGLLLGSQAGGYGGEEVSSGLQRLAAGRGTDVGPQALRSSLAYVMSGESLDLVGTTSALDWDEATHETASDVGLWCLTRDKAGLLALRSDAGPRWNGRTREVSGVYDCL